MTVAQLIAKLQTLPQDSKILVDQGSNQYNFPADVMGEAVVVATGIGYKVSIQNKTDYWVGATPWEHEWAGAPLNGVPSVYIGTGLIINEMLWQKV